MKLPVSLCLVATPVAAIAFLAPTANAATGLNATAQVALTSSTAGNNKYTITVNNTSSDTPIGTFWFAWTPPGQPIEYSFLPSMPSATTQPTGWIAPIITSPPGYSIEYYNITGSAIQPNQSAQFTFTTTDSPTTLQGTSLGFPIMTSFIYSGFPETGATADIVPTFTAAPEPASLTLLSIAALALLHRRRA